MTLTILVLILGYAILIKGAGWLVSGSGSLAKQYHILDLPIGSTIVLIAFMFSSKKYKLERLDAALLTMGYVGYITHLLMQ